MRKKMRTRFSDVVLPNQGVNQPEWSTSASSIHNSCMLVTTGTQASTTCHLPLHKSLPNLLRTMMLWTLINCAPKHTTFLLIPILKHPSKVSLQILHHHPQVHLVRTLATELQTALPCLRLFAQPSSSSF